MKVKKMSKNISWKNSEVTKIARRMLEIMPTEMVEKVRDQVKNGANTRIHGLYDYIHAAQDVLPAKRRKIDRTIDAPNVNRLKAVLASIRSTNQNNYYQPKAIKSKAPKISKKAATKIEAQHVTHAVVDSLKSIEAQLKAMGISSENRSKVLNQVVSCQ